MAFGEAFNEESWVKQRHQEMRMKLVQENCGSCGEGGKKDESWRIWKIVTEIADVRHHVEDGWKEPLSPSPHRHTSPLHSSGCRAEGNGLTAGTWAVFLSVWGIRKCVHREAGKDLSESRDSLAYWSICIQVVTNVYSLVLQNLTCAW